MSPLRSLIATWCAAIAIAFLADVATAESDILIADFEGETYGNWKVEGRAFGPHPAAGTLANQMDVTGFRGKQLVNSFYEGDDSTGKLTSPEFRIERKHINFLIGGGHHPKETSINLIVNEAVVRSATGPNDRPGGSERLDWTSWDVAEFIGKMARLEIVDERQGGWGHINIDDISQSDRALLPETARRELVIESRYLHLPVKNGAPMRHVTMLIDGNVARQFDIELAAGDADFSTFVDLDKFQGRKLVIDAGKIIDGNQLLKSITAHDTLPAVDDIYRESQRPQFHFTSRRGWLNDPNGLVYHAGEWHLFYQHNPYGWSWGNMHWGHAVSKDLLHWQELPDALYPGVDAKGACFSGSAIVDRDNTGGFKTGDRDVLIAAFTDTGAGESLAFSNDLGRSWQTYAKNPIVKHAGRDPKIVWHAPTRRWVMVVYDESEKSQNIAFYSSPDLKDWRRESLAAGYFECPDLLELPVDGDAKNTKWVLYAADGRYMLGDFDGKQFHSQTDKLQLWHGNFYAAQTFFGAPQARCVQIGWGRGIEFPNMPFNQQMTFPVELTLRTTADGVRMFAEPVREIAELQGKKFAWKTLAVAGERKFDDARGGLYRLRGNIEIGQAKLVGLTVGGVPVTYDVAAGEIQCLGVRAKMPHAKGKISLEILADRGSVEVFGDHGRVALSIGTLQANDAAVGAFAVGGAANFHDLEIIELESAWARPE